ncbi:DUF3265 domain-containing protein [Vibrio vulnificus]|nr:MULTISPECIES: DUF3265 domain-containing protein [Vibrio]MCU8408684.1 DUF3265 domain-containing protein [Vibrio vulnificus]MDE0544929.1 DUF3265 domain-containing protein [Vibrio sp. VA3]MDF4741830.1 DUF3265 domain-containing protein [Vibrio parahaemolyticus]TNZ67336.1 DUF3265 domain-containing protein [Vibrio parahaemolyticus]HAS8277808.1 DUF3265 domain-containing protein [Vibrio vulnificus]
MYYSQSCRVCVSKRRLTNCSSGIHNAWHFYYALILVIKVVFSGFVIALFTP